MLPGNRASCKPVAQVNEQPAQSAMHEPDTAFSQVAPRARFERATYCLGAIRRLTL
jgi:hypothetical protein